MIEYLIFCLILLQSQCINAILETCASDDYWCSDDGTSSRNEFLIWLTAICVGLSLLLYLDKKLSFMVILWYFTVLSFIFLENNMAVWSLLLAIDWLYYAVFLSHDSLDAFGKHRFEHLFVKVTKQRVQHQRMIRELKQYENKNKLLKLSQKNRDELFKKQEMTELGYGLKSQIKRTYYEFKTWLKSIKKESKQSNQINE